MRKRMVVLALSAVMALGAVGCGDTSEDVDELEERIEELERENRQLRAQLGVEQTATEEHRGQSALWDTSVDAAEEHRGLYTPVDSRVPADFTAEASGFCGADLIWEYGGGILYIHGTGEMTDYYVDTVYHDDSPAPWYNDFRGTIARVYVGEGCTSIGDYAFYKCSALSGVEIANSVTRIGEKAFEDCGELRDITLPDSVTEIGGGAFSSCDKLTYIKFPSGMREIDFEWLGGSDTIHIVLPDALETVKHYDPVGYDYQRQEVTEEQYNQIEEQLVQDYTAAITADPYGFWYSDLMDKNTIGRYGTITWRGRDYAASEVQDFLNDLISIGAITAPSQEELLNRVGGYASRYVRRHYYDD